MGAALPLSKRETPMTDKPLLTAPDARCLRLLEAGPVTLAMLRDKGFTHDALGILRRQLHRLSSRALVDIERRATQEETFSLTLNGRDTLLAAAREEEKHAALFSWQLDYEIWGWAIAAHPQRGWELLREACERRMGYLPGRLESLNAETPGSWHPLRAATAEAAHLDTWSDGAVFTRGIDGEWGFAPSSR